MAQITPYLFVYGTLLSSQNQYGAYLQQHCTFLQTGKFRGRLYDMGEYPGAVFSDEGDQYVHGSIYQMDDTENILSFIDDYEGFGANQEQPNLFIRILKGIETPTETITCWVYIYNLSVEHLPHIKSGRYL
ncbi:MAG: gamma-glutamylcyclotransferase family protein [Mucilaginibacter sp.]|uniref:gamma-glutamylcyclotransferase family protein n=1 Tax=Mucilaginibacter sp. TaxID=1882438 RepID=UPI0031B046C1